ncbi:MAG: hypothetical protein A3C53_01420 [Omnitrophica WOR_2 bacterium RIFCSPHIGHO2_02_FULL_68_15]|nr:MAG: hypothetical protein A3C53_01420 [Omnitrophica WOR_2 bacterium RIFCSPHIGHO2_02_FULL_68_15]
MTTPPERDPRIVLAGRWLTKRRGVLLAPLFAIALFSARWAGPWPVELAWDAAGVLCVVFGTWLRMWAASYHDSDLGDRPITAGPYAWIRHPLYTANFLLGLGIVLIAGWWLMVVVYLAVFFPLHIVIAWAEERHLGRLYGPAYPEYRRAVPAFLPWRRFRGPSWGVPGEFKLQQGRERLKVVGYVAAGLAVLAWKWGRGQWIWPVLPSLTLGPTVAVALIVTAAIIIRPRLRSSWLRSAQTVVAVIGALLLAVQLPAVWAHVAAIIGLGR